MSGEILLTSLPRADLRALIQELTSTNVSPRGWPTVWYGEPIPFVGAMNGAPGAYIELGIDSYRSLGVDDYRQTYNATTKTNTSALAGVRLFTLTIDCHSYTFDIPAFDILEVVRMRLNNPANVTARNALQNAGLSVARCMAIIDLNEVADNRPVFRSTLDVVMNWASNVVVGDDGGGVILTVGNPTGPAGTPTGTVQVTGTLLPP